MSNIRVEQLKEFKHADLSDLVSATQDAIREGIGFNWVIPPGPDILESFWQGALMVPQRTIFGGRLDGTLASSIQLVKPGITKESSAFAATLEAHFVAPWARGHGLAKALLDAAEHAARIEGFSVLRLSVRETQEPAIQLYEENGYIHWGTLPAYEFVSGRMVAGRFYYKTIEPMTQIV